MKTLKNTRVLLSIVAILVIGVYAVMAATGEDKRLIYNRTISTVATGSGALDFELSPNKSVEIREIRLHLSGNAGSAEAFVIQLDSGRGAVYDCVYLPAATTVTAIANDYWIVLDPPIVVGFNDELDINWANSNSVTWGLEVIGDYRGN